MLSLYLKRLPPKVRDECVALFNATPRTRDFSEEDVVRHTRQYEALGAPLISAASLAVLKYYGFRQDYRIWRLLELDTQTKRAA